MHDLYTKTMELNQHMKNSLYKVIECGIQNGKTLNIKITTETEDLIEPLIAFFRGYTNARKLSDGSKIKIHKHLQFISDSSVGHPVKIFKPREYKSE